MDYPSDLRKELYQTYDMLRCAYSDLMPHNEYWAIVHLFSEIMTFRAMATILSYFTGKTYDDLLTGSIYGIETDPPPSPEDMAIVREKLDACGYQEWLIKHGW